MSWVGLHGKTLWDWLDLFIVPAVLAIGVFLLNRAVQRGQERRTTDQLHQKTLEDYLDRMSQLILTHGLLRSVSGDDVRTLATARTRSALRGLDGWRKAEIVRFLLDANLIRGAAKDGRRTGGVISMAGADLDGVELAGAALHGVDLSGALMRRANLRGAVLAGADLTQLDVEWIDLTDAILTGADLRGSRLSGVYLGDAQLSAPELQDADISRADPRG